MVHAICSSICLQANEIRLSFEAQRAEDKRVLETLAEQLIEERNAAVKEVQELKQVGCESLA